MLSKWCEITSCNGIIDLYQARTNKRHFIFWSAVMTGTAVFSVYFTYLTIKGYIEKPFVTNVVSKPVSKLDLPEILIYYTGGFNVPVLQKAGFSEGFIHYLSRVSLEGTNTPSEGEKNFFLNYTMANNLSFVQAYRKFGYKCEEIITELATAKGPKLDPCNFTEEIMQNTGPAYVFKNNGEQWYPNVDAGLRFVLKAPSTSYAVMYPSQAFDIGMYNEFSITIERIVGHVSSYRSLYIPSNAKASIVLNPTKYTRIAGKTCESDNKKSNSSNECFFQCWTKEFIKACNCTPMEFIGYNILVPVCGPFDYCDLTSVYGSAQGCNSKCLRTCEEWIFSTSVSYTALDANLQNRSLSKVVIYYDSMQFTHIEEVVSFTLDMAIANIGGQSGLWLGISIVTIIQGIYYLFMSYASCEKVQTMKK